jgi:SAM-dependent methyltransferase
MMFVVAVSVAFLAGALLSLLVERWRRRWREGRANGVVRRVAIGEFAPALRSGTLGPDRSTAVALISNVSVPGGISDLESWVLCNLARSARSIFEFGTATGKTTFLLARNAPEATVTTVTLAPGDLGSFRSERGDDARMRKEALRESAFDAFVYTGTPEERRIRQLYGDSKALEMAEFEGKMDVVFIDGAHVESYVRNDLEKALRMVKPGGLVVWHDYRGPLRCPGVYRTLRDLGRRLPLFHLSGTSLVVFRAPETPPIATRS